MDSDAIATTAPRWSLRLFDGWQLRCGDAAVVVAYRERRLLSLLALQGERPRAHLAGLLWPESEEGRAHGNLRAAVWRIQHLLDGVLEESQGMMALAPGVHVDVHDLRGVAHQVTAGQDPPDTARALQVLRRGTLLPGWYDDWALEEREQLHQLRLRALEALADRLLDHDELHGALQAAMGAVQLEPLRESAHRALIRVHLKDGNHVEAVRVYRAFKERLSEELGISVSHQIVDLIRPLQAVHPRNDLPPPDAVP
ncbi:AfsR/SARP family transcriptional regulator [Georgenia thermotolerans]|uniref:SARP family transcriptional regulator n=1 Tax=Georgenia thermotolerans TaxID=527326 RepID=A0A7J5UN54_9MICO|nr:BTAD domain-containing putative transcriptional regulator [Georgenia thermotolerans]KAE8763524.1 SARP family transcriptional regulator [Georgenia thermotolerans]